MKPFLWFLLFLLTVSVAFADDEISNQSDFLDVDQAFKVSLGGVKNETINVDFKIADGHYLYKKRIDIKVSEPFKVLEIVFPKPDVKNDPNFGISQVYHGYLSLPVRLKSSSVNSGKVEIDVHYQGCSEKGLCYPPNIKKFTLDIQGVTNSQSEINDITSDGQALLGNGNFWLIVLGFFGLGLLLSLTPCVFPMIPILSGIIVGQSNSSKGQAFKLSLAYTFGMALSYTFAGILAALTGNMISSALQNPWVLSVFSMVFVVLAMSMFGFYELQLPSSLSGGLTTFTNRLKGGKFLGVFAMGALSALIVSPCVAAPLAGALIYISKTHDVILGGTALFSLSMGMGVPLLIVGASAGVLLPKAGMWMEAVKNFFGVTMLGMAIWIVAPVIPHAMVLFLYATLTIVSSIYLGAFEPLKEGVMGWVKLRKGFGIILFLTGVVLFFNGLQAANLILNGPSSEATQLPEASSLKFKRIKNLDDLNSQLAQSKDDLIMLDFYADWCSACKEYEAITFKDSKVVDALSGSTLLQVDVTANNQEDKALMKKFELYGPPGIIFFDRSGNVLAKIIGYQNPEDFHSTISKVVPSK
jgi:thiol:disulfide interchange protein DsbD